MVTSYDQESFNVTDNSRLFFTQKLFASEIRNDHTNMLLCMEHIIRHHFNLSFPPFLRVDQCWSMKYVYYILVL